MATYKQIQEFVKDTYGYSPKSCWIAHMKAMCGLRPRLSPNRYSVDKRTNSCPVDKQADIKNAFKVYNSIQNSILLEA